MKINMIEAGTTKIAEVIADTILIKTPQDALDLMANISCDHIVLYEHNLEKNFFDLKTRLAGEILQKFSNYQINLAIIGNYKKFTSSSLQAFIYESNKNKDYLFVSSLEEVKKMWGK